MKAYLFTTGTIFGLLALLHLWVTITHWSRLQTEPGFILQGPGIGVVAAGLWFWAWRLLRALPASGKQPDGKPAK